VFRSLQIECHDVACDAVQSTLQQNCQSCKHTTRQHEKRTQFETKDNLRILRNLEAAQYAAMLQQGRHKTALVRSVTATCQIMASTSGLTK
jgi:hypothetical protein